MHFESFSASETHISAECKCVGSILMQGEPRMGGRVEKGIQKIRERGRLTLHGKKIMLLDVKIYFKNYTVCWARSSESRKTRSTHSLRKLWDLMDNL